MRFLGPAVSIVLFFLLSFILTNSRASQPAILYPPMITTDSLPEAKLNLPYQTQVAGRDQSTTDSLKMTIANLPEGLRQDQCQSSLANNEASIICTVFGSPLKAENTATNITLTNSQTGLTASKTFFLPIGTPSAPAYPTPAPLANTPPLFNFESLPPGFFLGKYNLTLNVTDHNVNDRLTLSAKGLPYNLSLSNCAQTTNLISQTANLHCLISGRVMIPGIFRPVFTVSDSQSPPVNLALTLIILP